MKFEVGERVHFIYAGKLRTGSIKKFSQGQGELYAHIEVDDDQVYVKVKTDNIAKLDEPKPVVVPKETADFIKTYGSSNDSYSVLATIMKDIIDCYDPDTDDLFIENLDKNIQAVLNGYVVEEEKKYYVKLPEPFGYLRRSKLYPTTYDVRDASKYTKKEIKKLDERYWSFAVPVEEVEAE